MVAEASVPTLRHKVLISVSEQRAYISLLCFLMGSFTSPSMPPRHHGRLPTSLNVSWGFSSNLYGYDFSFWAYLPLSGQLSYGQLTSMPPRHHGRLPPCYWLRHLVGWRRYSRPTGMLAAAASVNIILTVYDLQLFFTWNYSHCSQNL